MQGYYDSKKILAIMTAVVGMVLLLVSFILPWWGLHLEIDGSASGGGFGVSISSGISYQGSGTSFYIGDSTPIVYSTAAILIILALIFTALMITALMISLINNYYIRPKLPFQLGVLALVFCLLAPIIFMIALPMAMKADAEEKAEDSGFEFNEPDRDDPTKSFFGSYEEEGGFYSGEIKSNWGGDIGWVLSFISFLFLAISVNLIRPRRPAPLPQQLPPQQTYMPTAQPPPQAPRSRPLPPPPPKKQQ
jgi:hypothetical protein